MASAILKVLMSVVLTAFWAIGCGGNDIQDPMMAQIAEETGPLYSSLEKHADAPLVHFRLGEVYRKFGMDDSARVAYQRSIRLQEAFPEAHFQLAQIQYANGNTKASLHSYLQT